MENRKISLPRKIKWTTEQGEEQGENQGEEDTSSQIYDFYRQIIQNCILRLKIEKGNLHGKYITKFNA